MPQRLADLWAQHQVAALQNVLATFKALWRQNAVPGAPEAGMTRFRHQERDPHKCASNGKRP